MSTSTVAILLLLTLFPMLTLAARRVPAPPPPASPTPTPTHQVVLEVLSLERAGSRQDSSRKTNLGCNVLSWNANPSTSDDSSVYGHRRMLVGSSPPTCQGKCGACNPCNPIHVSIGSPHGALTQQEYYPEVWRCKCGNQLFMP